MNSKLTLTVEKTIIERAKIYAKQKNRSLSDIIENYLKMLTRTSEDAVNKDYSPIVSSLKGVFESSEEFDYKEELIKRLEEKHLAKK